MGVVFVDIDGVLRRGWARPSGVEMPMLDKRAVDALIEIARRDPQLEFVLSSQWRNDYGYAETVSYLESLGFPKDRFIGKTPSVTGVPSSERRRAEIRRWLNAHGKKRYVILDNNMTLGDLSAKQIGRSGLLGAGDVSRALKMVKE